MEKWNTCALGCINVNVRWCSHVENGMITHKIESRIIMWSSNLTSEWDEREWKAESQRDICTPMFTAALFPITKRRKQPKCPTTDNWIMKTWHIHILEYYAAFKKKEIMSCATTWMKLEDVMPSKSQPVTKEEILSDFTHMKYPRQSTWQTESKKLLPRPQGRKEGN